MFNWGNTKYNYIITIKVLDENGLNLKIRVIDETAGGSKPENSKTKESQI